MQQSIIIPFLTFSVSLYGLMRGADFLIDGSSDLARKAKVSELFIGLTIIALGTSLPELVVSVRSAFMGNVSLAYSNVIGSNLTNTLLVLGACAAVRPMNSSAGVKNDIPFYMLLILFFSAAIAATIDFASKPLSGVISKLSGVGLLLFFAGFIYRTYKNRNLHLDDVNPVEEGERNENAVKSVFLITIGLALLLLGGDYAVTSAVKIATLLKIPESTIGLTIVALGTSLPELVTCLSAAFKGKGDLAIGNILGSNFMNITLVLGCSSLVKDININSAGLMDMCIQFFVSIIFSVIMLRKNKPTIGKSLGLSFLFLYAAYMAYVGYRS